jgi:pSer/pThr/pTyr-binding forkhead associated (FHA) protein
VETLDQPSAEELAAREAAERLGERFLVYRDGEGRQVIHTLGGNQPTVTIGRRDEADIAIAWDPELSRLHAELELHAGEWTITDDGLSQNGTYVNEVRLDGRRRLADGDLIRVGRTRITYSVPDGDGEEVTLLPGDLAAAPAFSDQQQDVLRALCRPLFGDGEGVGAADPVVIAAETGIPLDVVESEIDQLERTFGLEDLPSHERRAEIALLAVRSGVVGRGDYA